MAWVAALCAGLAAWWLVPGASEGLGRLASRPAVVRPRRAAPRVGLAALATAAVVVAAGVLGGPGGAAVALAVAQVVGCVVLLAVRRAARAARARRRAEVVGILPNETFIFQLKIIKNYNMLLTIELRLVH